MRATLLVLMLAAACFTPGCQKAESPPASAKAGGVCQLTVGWDPWEPYQYEDADGTVRGLDIEIAALLAQDTGCTLTHVRGNWIDLLDKLRQGQVDVLLAATPIAEREQYAWFSEPYRQESFSLYVRSEELGALSTQSLRTLLADGKHIGYTEGYFYGAEVNELASDDRYAKNFVAAPVVEVNYTRLLDGTIDALLDDPFVASSVIRRKGWNGRIARHPVEITSGRVSLMFSRKKVPEDVVRRFNAALDKRRADSSLAQVLSRYRS